MLGREDRAETMVAAACGHLRTLLGATACMISRVDDGTLREVAVAGPAQWSLEENLGYLLDDYPETKAVLEKGEARTASLSDADVDPSEAFVLRSLGMHVNLMLPLQLEGRPWGLIEIFDAGPRVFGLGEVGLAQVMAGHLEALLAKLEQADQSQHLYYETLASLSNALEAKDGYTGDHAQEVGDLALAVGRRLGLEGRALRVLEFGALLHDIGKIRIPEAILNKPGPLTADEWIVMRTHPEAGVRILEPIASLSDVIPVVRWSHERWDGHGYPDGLAGEQIPLPARVVAVCDAYRAMIEPRPYRDPHERDWARAELRGSAGTQFDPACVQALLGELDARERRATVLTLHRPDHVRD